VRFKPTLSRNCEISRPNRLIKPGHLLRRPSVMHLREKGSGRLTIVLLPYLARGFSILATHSTPLSRSRSNLHGARTVWPVAAPLAVVAIAILSIAFGSVSIPPQTVLGVLLAQMPFAHITADGSAAAES